MEWLGLQRAGDDLFHDLVAATVDAADAGIGPGAAHLVFGHVAVAAVQLQELVEQAVLQRRGIELDHGGTLGGQLALHVQLHAFVHKGAQHGGLRLGLGQLEARVLELEHRLAEGLALAGVVDGFLQEGLDAPGRAHRHDQALLGQLLHQVPEAHVLLAQQVAHGHLDVVKEKFGGVLSHQADLFELAAFAEPRCALFHHDQRHALGAQIGRGLADHDHDLGIDAVGDEGLGAVDDVVVAFALGGGAHGFEVAARAGLGHGDGADHFTGGHLGQPAVALLLVAVSVDVGRHDVRVQRKTQCRGVGAAHFLDQHRRMAKVTAAAVGLGQHGVEQALAAGLAPHFLGHDAVALPLGQVRHDFLVKEVAHGVTELFMVFAVDGALDQVLHGRCLKK